MLGFYSLKTIYFFTANQQLKITSQRGKSDFLCGHWEKGREDFFLFFSVFVFKVLLSKMTPNPEFSLTI